MHVHNNMNFSTNLNVWCFSSWLPDPLQEMVPEQRRFCRGSDICTSRCHCTDGMKDTMDNETEIYDDMNDVDDQGTLHSVLT